MSVLDAWEFELPLDRIASHPAARRDASRLMVLPRTGGPPTDHVFSDVVDLLRPGDLLVANDTRVVPARLRARRASGGAVELVLLGTGPGEVLALGRPQRRLADGEVLTVGEHGTATIVGRLPEVGLLRVRTSPEPLVLMAAAGELPLPPYLGRAAGPDDAERYQTVYARTSGSAAAPTAGLHFTPSLLAALAARGVGFATVTLHVGLGTFRPLTDADVAAGVLHPEPWWVPEATVDAVTAAKAAGGRVIAVGTTSVRVLASAAEGGALRAGAGVTRLFLRPPDAVPVVDGLITNFHLPRSSLLMLVACLVGRERLLDAYAQAVRRGYRFYSYGDAMLLV